MGLRNAAARGFHSLTDLQGAEAGEGESNVTSTTAVAAAAAAAAAGPAGATGASKLKSPPRSPVVRGLGPSFATAGPMADSHGGHAPPMQTTSGKTLYSGPVNSSFGVDLAAMAAAQAQALAASAEAMEGAIEASRARAGSRASSLGGGSGSDVNNTDSSVPVSPVTTTHPSADGSGVFTSPPLSFSFSSNGGTAGSGTGAGAGGAGAPLAGLPENLRLRLPVTNAGGRGTSRGGGGRGGATSAVQRQQQQQRARDIASALGSLGGRHSFSTSCLAGLVGG